MTIYVAEIQRGATAAFHAGTDALAKHSGRDLAFCDDLMVLADALGGAAGLPTIGEFVPGYEASGWHGIGAPKGMPVQIVDRLNTEINASLADPKMKARLAELGDTVLPGSPAGFGQFIADETEK